MSSYEEAEVRDDGSVIIRYYFGKSVLIPEAVMKKEAIPLFDLPGIVREKVPKEKIKLRPRRFIDGRI